MSFDIYGLLLFLIIMIPNIWFAVTAPNNVRRADSITEVVDAIASVCQVLMAIALFSIFTICHLTYGAVKFII